MTYDIIIIIKTFYISSRTNGGNFVSIRQVITEKNTKVLHGQTNKQTNKDRQTDKQTNKQTNKQTDPNATPTPLAVVIKHPD